jgi:hypothetical protein
MAAKTPEDLCDTPLVVVVYRGAVILNGPGNVALAMTVEAAERSATRLADAIQRARLNKRRQQVASN